MKTLLLLRHAKSSWADATLRDFDRPLNSRGRDAAERIGKHVAAQNLGPAVVICSPALRARETAQILLQTSRLAAQVRFDERIYEASLSDLLHIVSDIPKGQDVVIMIGHNPGFEQLLSFLTNESRRMPTCALAKIKLQVERWKDVRTGEGSLEWFIAPRELPG